MIWNDPIIPDNDFTNHRQKVTNYIDSFELRSGATRPEGEAPDA